MQGKKFKSNPSRIWWWSWWFLWSSLSPNIGVLLFFFYFKCTFLIPKKEKRKKREGLANNWSTRWGSDLLCPENSSAFVSRDFSAIDCVIIIFYVLNPTTENPLSTEAQWFRERILSSFASNQSCPNYCCGPGKSLQMVHNRTELFESKISPGSSPKFWAQRTLPRLRGADELETMLARKAHKYVDSFAFACKPTWFFSGKSPQSWHALMHSRYRCRESELYMYALHMKLHYNQANYMNADFGTPLCAQVLYF